MSARHSGPATAALALVLAACAGGASPGSVASERASTQPSGSSASPLASAAPSASLDPLPGAHEAGRPYSAQQVLDLMAGSRRPGGVPAQLQEATIAQAVADELWTYDGGAWDEASAGGSCGPSHCTLEIGGSRAGAVGEDLYIFDVTLATGAVVVLSAELRGLPRAAVEELDAWARGHWPDAPLPGPMASARWTAPPDDAVFILSYRSGGEENSPAVDAVIDLDEGSVTLREPGQGS